MSNDIYDVAIVGYGPAGLVAASLLGGMGHRVVVVERYPSLYGLPRLTHIDGETARIIQAAGDVDAALRDAQALDSFKYLNAAGELLLELPWAGDSSGHPAHISMYQPDIEDAIDTRVRAYSNMVHLSGWLATSVRLMPGEISLTARQVRVSEGAPIIPDRPEIEIRAKYLLGADGANSFIRESLDIGQTDFGVDERWLNIDTKTKRELPERFNYTMLFCDPARPHMFMPIGKNRQRFEFAALTGEGKDELEDRDRAWTWLKDTHELGPDDVEIIRQVLYPIKATMADSWSRENRVFLMGDAAHTMPPTMGQGACSGMRDAITISWKLDLVLRGLADVQLLTTYENERGPHAQTIVETSVLLGEIAYTMDPAKAADRDQTLLTGSMPPPPPFPVIADGVIQTDEGVVPSPFAGMLSPQGVVSSNDRVGRFDDLFGAGFRLVARVPTKDLLSVEEVAFLNDIGCTMHTTAPGEPRSFSDDAHTYGRFFDEIDADLFISRPDFVVFGAATAEGATALVSQLKKKLYYLTSNSASASAALR